MARPRTLKLDNQTFKEYLLKNFINESGKKVSLRKLIITDEFMNDTGLHRPNKHTGIRESVSVGTVSNWMYRTLKDCEPYLGRAVTDDTIYQYGIDNKLIDTNIKFSEWAGVVDKSKKEIKSESAILRRIAIELGSAFTPKDVDNDLEVFREYLADVYTETQIKKAVEVVKNGG